MPPSWRALVLPSFAAPVERLERMGRAGALRVAEYHDAATEAAKLVTHFRQVVAPPARPFPEGRPWVESAGVRSGSPSTHFAGS